MNSAQQTTSVVRETNQDSTPEAAWADCVAHEVAAGLRESGIQTEALRIVIMTLEEPQRLIAWGSMPRSNPHLPSVAQGWLALDAQLRGSRRIQEERLPDSATPIAWLQRTDEALGSRPELRAARAALGLGAVKLAGVLLPDERIPAEMIVQVDLAAAAETAGLAGNEADLLRLRSSLLPVIRCIGHLINLPSGPWAAWKRRNEMMSLLTRSQREVLPMLISGMCEREIAKTLFRSPHTIHDHVKSIYATLGLSSRVALVEAWHGCGTAPKAIQD